MSDCGISVRELWEHGVPEFCFLTEDGSLSMNCTTDEAYYSLGTSNRVPVCIFFKYLKAF